MLPQYRKIILVPCKCSDCGCVEARIDVAKGPHGFGLRCFACNRHNGWMKKADSQALAEAEKL